MASAERLGQELKFTWAEGATLSNYHNAGAGVGIGAIMVPAGSALIGKTLQFVAHSPTALYADADCLATPITLVAGLNRLTVDQLEEIAFVVGLKLKLNTAVNAESTCILIWKS